MAICMMGRSRAWSAALQLMNIEKLYMNICEHMECTNQPSLSINANLKSANQLSSVNILFDLNAPIRDLYP